MQLRNSVGDECMLHAHMCDAAVHARTLGNAGKGIDHPQRQLGVKLRTSTLDMQDPLPVN